ncbi:hypothetical protein FSP39_001293 [Pinctada imbricata]|uniref:Sacsin/Nov domain-containing protein n=1 Tax=Pinctada imbricata TaxID=66713 RepID=A0AA88Y1E6_PINIB|nr:hypothetical protein FSP39_001293 [Pinctada imbricata]
MIKLLRLFYESAGNLLLFTQNVQEISLHHLQNDSIHPDDDMVLVFKVDKQELFIPRLNKRNILTTFTEASKKAMREERSKTKQTFICRTNIRITNSCGLADVVDGGKDGDTFESEWLISWSLGVGKSFRMYIEGGSDGALPLTAVALPISEKGNLHIYDASLGFYRESHLFVFLPIPVKVPFSVHINGCFAVSADRKRLLSYTSDDKTDSRQVTWNSVLISDSLLNSYLQFLAYVRNNCLHDVSGFYYLWPKDCGPENTWKPLLKEFYKHVVEEEDLKMFFGFRNKESVWLTFDECTFLDESFSNDSKICSLAYTVLKCLSKEHNICPTELPQTIRKAFVEAGLSSDINRKTISIEAFYEIFLKNIANIELDLHDKERLVIHALRQENKNIMQHLMTNACITSKPKGNFHLPSEMVLPNSPWKSLFDTEDERFPSDAFCREDILKALQNLGMKTSEIPWDLIRLQARKNENINTKCTECARERAEIILKYIHENRRSDQACPKDVADDISDIEFIPAMTKSAEWKWKWKADECLTESKVCCAHELSWKSMKLNKPKNMYISNLALQVGCSDILTPEYFHEYQEDLFELGVKGEEQVGIKTLREQLLHVTESHLCSENVSESLELRILEAVFKSFESRCHDDEAISFLNEFLDKPVIKIGKRFVSPCSVVFSLKHDCSPFLYGLDNSPFLQYKNTLEAMGVRKQFDFQTLKFVLKQLKDRDEPLDESEIGLACRVALLLEDVELDDLDFLYLPDSEGILRPTTELCIDDCSWVPQSDTMKFLHGTIPPNIAKITKIRSKRNHDITEETSEFGIDFGQHENLTNRLKRILDGYPDVCIMKELLQNADDAGATELHFIKDFRELGKESVFSEEWKDLQGPALCVYNDSVFSERDLEGIQNLGIGSNREDLTTIGKYGVGFNAVYHLTDVPSFLSKDKSNPERDTLCVLDPHCRYIPCATKRKPGRRFKDPSKTKQKYPDVFSGYLEDSGVWCENSGTMFRFPLRQACSDISPSIDIERFNVLIEQFKHEMAHSMMFLHNVRRIIISSIDKDGELHKEHFADSKISGESGNAIYNTTLETRMKLKEHKVSMSDIQRLGNEIHHYFNNQWR